MCEVICLNPDYSTTRRLTHEMPVVLNKAHDKFDSALLLPTHPRRKSEGGLRVQGYFKRGGYFDQDRIDAKTHPLVTIITIVFNGAKTVEQTILSVLSQSFDNIEYIIIDGGSTDGTLDIIRKYAHAIDYWVSEPDLGISDAFNKGIQVSSGLIIGMINADDWYEPKAVEIIVPLAASGEYDIVHGKLQYWHENEKTELVSGNHTLLEEDMTVNHVTVFMKHALYKRIGYFSKDFRYAMDYELLLRAKKSNANFKYVESCLANMRWGGVSDSGWRSALQEVARAKLLHTQNKIGPWAYYSYQIIKCSVRKILQKAGLRYIIDFYHARFSKVRKIANRN